MPSSCGKEFFSDSFYSFFPLFFLFWYSCVSPFFRSVLLCEMQQSLFSLLLLCPLYCESFLFSFLFYFVSVSSILLTVKEETVMSACLSGGELLVCRLQSRIWSDVRESLLELSCVVSRRDQEEAGDLSVLSLSSAIFACLFPFSFCSLSAFLCPPLCLRYKLLLEK